MYLCFLAHISHVRKSPSDVIKQTEKASHFLEAAEFKRVSQSLPGHSLLTFPNTDNSYNLPLLPSPYHTPTSLSWLSLRMGLSLPDSYYGNSENEPRLGCVFVSLQDTVGTRQVLLRRGGTWSALAIAVSAGKSSALGEGCV